MSNSASFADKWKSFWEKASPVFKKIGNIFSQTGFWIWRLRKVLMAIPVVYAAVRLAIDNMNRLPENVGLNLQEAGEFALMVTRNYAVFGPLGVTIFCLILMFCSRKPLFPWVVSIFTLVLPVLIWLTNVYPA